MEKTPQLVSSEMLPPGTALPSPSWPPPQPQLLSDTHCIALHMKMSCHIFQPLKQEIIFGRGGFDSSALQFKGRAQGRERRGEKVQQTNIHAGLLAVHSEGTRGLWEDTKLLWTVGVKEQLYLLTSEDCSFLSQGQLLQMQLQDMPLR